MALSAANEAQVRQIIAEELTAALASGGSIDTAIQAAMTAHEVKYHGVTPPPVDPPVDPPVNPFRDATTATLTNEQGMGIYTDALNFEGAGYVGTWTKPGETVTWVVNVPSDGVYQILVSYQNAGGGDAHRLVNGKLAAFPRTTLFGDWHAGTWTRDYMFEFEFHAGANTISFAVPADSTDDNYLDLNGWDSLIRVGDLPVDPPPVDPPPVDPPVDPTPFMDATVGLQLNPNGSQIQTNAPGFKGAGFLGTWGQPGEAIAFPVTVDRDGLYSIALRYQCAAPDATREVNGVPMTLPRTAPDNAWDQGSWTDATATNVRLSAGRGDVTISIPGDSPAWSNWCDLNGIWKITRTGDLPPIDPPPVDPPVDPPPSGNVIDVSTLGILPGSQDQQIALAALFANQAYKNKTLAFPAGDYRHSASFNVVVPNLTLKGPGALVGTNPLNMSIQLKADAIVVDGLGVRGVGTGRTPIGSWEECCIVLWNPGITVQNCDVSYSSAAGIISAGATNFTIRGNTVHSTWADGIHLTSGSNNGLVEGNTCVNVGDDCFAVVGYAGQDNHHIIIRNNVGTNGHARGVTVAGGRDITVENNKITASRAAGIYLASEPSYTTEGVDRIIVRGNTLTGCNTEPTLNHGGIFLWGGRSEKPVNDVIIDSNIIKDTPVGGAHMVIQGSNVHRTTFISNATTGTKPHHYIEAASADWTMQADTHNGAAVPNHGVVTPVNPSGEAPPSGDLPGWHLAYVEDFNTPRPLGSFGNPNAVPPEHVGKLTVYEDGWPSTNGGHGGRSIYEPSTVLSVEGGCLVKRLHTDGGNDHAAAVVVGGAQAGGRYVVRFKADAVPGYKTAWLLWPQSEVWPRDGEIDFPEGDLTGTISGFMHRQGATSGGDQDYAATSKRFTEWHTAIIEWLPGQRCTFTLDGVVVGSWTDRVPATPMHWVLQTEATLGNDLAPDGTTGRVWIDWIARYEPASIVTPPTPTGDATWATMTTVHKPGTGTQYVGPSGNDANPGTSGSRKRTVQAAINALGSGGGIVYVADGSYTFGGLSRSGGTNTAWVLVKAENRWGVKSTGFSLSGSYLGVYGVEVAGSDISYSNGAYLAVWRCYVHDHPAGQGIGGAGNNSHLSNVSCCYNVVHTTSRDNVWATSNISFYHFTNAIGSQNHDWVGGYDNLIVGNITHHGSQGPGTPQSDGNGIIIDDMQCLQNYGSDHSGINYRGNWLIMGNLAVANGPTAGVGIHCFQTDFVEMCFNTAAQNNSTAMDMNAGAGGGVQGDIRANLTWQTNWWDGYLWTGASDGNVFLAGSANPSGRGQLSGSRNRSGEGGNYFKTNGPTLYPDLTTAEQWRPDGGSGAVERYTVSQAQYNAWSVFPDLLGTTRPANRAWACGALES